MSVAYVRIGRRITSHRRLIQRRRTDVPVRPRPTTHAQPPHPHPRLKLRGDRGVSILEFTGFLPILLLVGMAAIQLGLIGYGINQAGSGARAAARAASQQGGPRRVRPRAGRP